MLWKGVASDEASARPERIAIARHRQQAHGSNRAARASKPARLLEVSPRLVQTEETSMWAKRGMPDERTMEYTLGVPMPRRGSPLRAPAVDPLCCVHPPGTPFLPALA